jgi:hypothetical protein
MTTPAKRRQTYDAYVRAWLFRSAKEHWQQLLDDHGVGEVVDGKLHLKSVLADSRRDGHDSGVTHKYVQPIMGEFLGCGFDRGERQHVHFQERGTNCSIDLCDLGL